jgi:hypothetical protein
MAMRTMPRSRNPYDPGLAADPLTSTIAVGAEAANAIAVTITLKTPHRRAMPGARRVRVWLSGSATTGAHVATAPTGGVAATTGSIIYSPVANKELVALTNATGVLVLTLTDTGTPTFYVWVEFPDGSTKVSGPVTFA